MSKPPRLVPFRAEMPVTEQVAFLSSLLDSAFIPFGRSPTGICTPRR